MNVDDEPGERGDPEGVRASPIFGFSTPRSKTLSRDIGVEDGQGGIFFDEDPRKALSEARSRRKAVLKSRIEEDAKRNRESARRRSVLLFSAVACAGLALGAVAYVALVEMSASSRVALVGLSLALLQTAIALLQARSSVGRVQNSLRYFETQFSNANQAIALNEVNIAQAIFFSEMAFRNTEELVSLSKLATGDEMRLRISKAPGALALSDLELENQLKLIQLGAFDEQLQEEIELEDAKSRRRKETPFYV